MRIYTYCTYKGSVSGYRYWNFNMQHTFNEEELNQDKRVITKWFEENCNWKMVLIKTGNNAYLLLKRLESSANYENSRRREENEENKLAITYKRNKDDKYEQIDYLEVDKCINIAVVDEYNKLERLAIGILSEYNNDFGLDFYLNISKCMKTDLLNDKYTFDTNQLINILENIKYKEKIRKNEEGNKSDINEKNILDNFLRKIHKKSSEVLINKNSDIRKRDFMNYIKNNWQISNDAGNILYVSENENINQYGSFCVKIDFNYFIR